MMAKHLDVQPRTRISSSPRLPSSPSPSRQFALGPAFSDSGVAYSLPATPSSLSRTKLDDDAFFTTRAPSNGSPRNGSPRRSDPSVATRLAFHRMRFLALDSSPPPNNEAAFVPSILGPPLGHGNIMREKTPPLIAPKSAEKRRGSSKGMLGDSTDDSGYSGSEEDSVSVPTRTLSPAPTPRRSRLEPKVMGPGCEEYTQPRLLPIERARSPRPTIVSTPPETPRRHRTLPATPPRTRPSTSSSKYHIPRSPIPRSPGTPHLGRTSELMRTPGSPMPRSPGCRSLSALT